MVAPSSCTVATGDLVQATDHNTLRCDTLCHNHCGCRGSATVAATSFTGAATVSASWTFSCPALFADGCDCAPGMAFSSQTGTGLIKAATNTIVFIQSGVQQYALTAEAFGPVSAQTGARDSGRCAARWRDIFLSRTIDLANSCADPTANGEIQRNGNDVKVFTGGGVVNFSDLPRSATGTYTGDGTTSQGVTCVGFAPKAVWITVRKTDNSTIGGAKEYLWTTDVIVDDNACGTAIEIPAGDMEGNAIISLDADGFTVDDAGADNNPNACGSIYNYFAVG